MKRALSYLLCLLLVCSLAACAQPGQSPGGEPVPAEGSPAEGTPAPASTGTYTPGTYTATARGFGGDVVVTITVDSENITDCVIVGDDETALIGGNAIQRMPEVILTANGAEVDGVSGATATSAAIKQALAAALSEAKGGGDGAAVKMAAGSYSASAYGFMAIAPLSVTVTVDESSILDIAVDGNLESKPMIDAVNTLMIPRMLENQSLSVDAITGATVSSNAVLLAARDAVAQALAAGGSDAAAVAAFLKPEEKTQSEEIIDVDVLVVGMGGSGCASAMSAAEHMYAEDPADVSVLAIDKAGKFGGTSAFCGEPMAVNAPRYKAEFNKGENYMDGDALYRAWLEYTEGDAKADIVKHFLDNSGDTIDWLYYDHGFLFNNPLTGFSAEDIYRCKYQYVNIANKEEGRDYGRDVDRSMNEMVDEYFHGLIEDYVALGGKYMLETEAKTLLYDSASNTIKGVKAVGHDGTAYTINAKSVILASGGFGGSEEMEIEYLSQNPYYPDLGGYWTMIGMTQNKGDMIRSAIELGAGTYNIDMVPMVHFATANMVIHDYPVQELEDGGLHTWYGWPNTWSLNSVPNALVLSSEVPWVNRHGERFVMEGQLFSWWIAGPGYYAIWSQDRLDAVAEKGFLANTNSLAQGSQGSVPGGMPIPEIYDIAQKAIDMGCMVKADTVAELAALMGVPAAALEKTLAAYESDCAAGKDAQFGKAAEKLLPLGEGPYYAMAGYSAAFSTVGGLDIDGNFNVLLADGETPISGLYAVGNESGGVLYSNKKPYVTYGGAALGWAFTSGRLAGGNAVKHALAK